MDELLFAGKLPRSNVNAACKRIDEVQDMTNKAAVEAGDRNAYSSPAVYGTAVHTILRRSIDDLNDPQLTAEVAVMKSLEETLSVRGSIRIDVVEDDGTGPICVYDIKTGKRGLSGPRSTEFARRLANYFRSRPIIVTEIRPFE